MSYLSFCYAMFGFLGKHRENDPVLGKKLSKAHMEMTPDAYIAWVAGTTLFVSIIGLVVGLVAYAVFIPIFTQGGGGGFLSSINMIPLIWIGLTFITILYFTGLIFFPDSPFLGNFPTRKARHRGSIADLYLPHAASFVAALAASNATMETIFLALSTQRAKKIGSSYWISKMFSWAGMETTRDVFPIISDESAAIYRDITILGVDTLSALQNAVDRAPSPWLAEFFQGTASTISSGGNLKLYFLSTAERFMEDIKQDQKVALEQLATQAEMFVTVAVAMPIFLIIILIITVWISTDSGDAGNSMGTLYMVIFVLVPVLHVLFAFMSYQNINKFSI